MSFIAFNALNYVLLIMGVDKLKRISRKEIDHPRISLIA